MSWDATVGVPFAVHNLVSDVEGADALLESNGSPLAAQR